MGYGLVVNPPVPESSSENDALYAALSEKHATLRGQRFFWHEGRFWRAGSNNHLFFVELDPSEQEPADPDNRWTKHNGPRLKEGEDYGPY